MGIVEVALWWVWVCKLIWLWLMGFVEGCWVKGHGVDGSWVVALAICMGCWVVRHSSHGFWHNNSGCEVLVGLLGCGVDGSQVVALAICVGC